MSAVDLVLHYEFLQRALAGAIIVAVIASALGVPVVLRNMAMFGLGFSHVAFAGVALGLALGVYPLGVALAVTVASAIALQWLWSRRVLSGDTALGIVVSVGFATGVIIVSLTGGFTTDLNSYLFGSLLAITPRDLWLLAPTGLALTGLFTLLYKEIFYVTFDEEAARLSGLPVDAINVLFISLTAATIVIASRIVGLLLVASLLIIPAATALQVAGSFRRAVLGAVAVGVASVVVGVLAAAQWDLATGGAVVVSAGAIFAATSLAKAAWLRARGAAA